MVATLDITRCFGPAPAFVLGIDHAEVGDPPFLATRNWRATENLADYYRHRDCDRYRYRYQPADELLVLADWWDEHAFSTDDDGTQHKLVWYDTTAEHLRGLHLYSQKEEMWQASVLPCEAVRDVRHFAVQLDAHDIVKLCEDWLARNEGEYLEVCSWCEDIIVEREQSEDEQDEQTYEHARKGLARRWHEQGYKLQSGWYHDPNGEELEYTNEWSSGQCNGCGRYPHGRRYPAMAWKGSEKKG